IPYCLARRTTRGSASALPGASKGRSATITTGHHDIRQRLACIVFLPVNPCAFVFASPFRFRLKTTALPHYSALYPPKGCQNRSTSGGRGADRRAASDI